MILFVFQLHSLFNLAHQFRVAVLRDRPLDYILKVITLLTYMPHFSFGNKVKRYIPVVM